LDVIKKDKLTCTTGPKLECTGEATVTNRKGRLRVFYELKLVLSWSGELKDSEGNVIGKVENSDITLPALSEEQNEDEFEIKMSALEKPNEMSDKIWRLMKKSGIEVIRNKVTLVLKELRAGAKWSPNNSQSPSQVKETTPKNDKKVETFQKVEKKKENSKFSSLEFTDEFRAPPHEIYDCLMNEKRFQFFTRVNSFKFLILKSGASIPKKEGEKFFLFSGSVEGKHLELVENKKIVQEWRFKDVRTNSFNFQVGTRSKLTLNN
jgi:activator of HSP90 ATPase